MVTKQVGRGTGIESKSNYIDLQSLYFVLGAVILTFALFINLDDMTHLKRQDILTEETQLRSQ